MLGAACSRNSIVRCCTWVFIFIPCLYDEVFESAGKMKIIIIIIIIIIINYIYIARRLRNGKGTGILFFSFFCQCFMSGNVVCLVGLFQNKYPSAPFQERPVPRALPYVRFGCFFHWMFKTLMYSHFFWGVGYPMNDPSLTWSATWVFFL